MGGGGGGGSTIGGGSVLGGHGTGMSNSTVGMGAPPGSLMHGGGPNGGAPGNIYGNGNGGVVGVGGGGGGGGQSTAPGSVIDSRAVSVVVTLPGGPGSQHPGQALSDYGPI
ncbi:putative glycine-rich cell wall structural protein 1 [Drosophila persimilis]|uniref:Glycine-rich cell wall structural protein 1 n=1 Tax=Drosophila pseudoobscura pseudoobscura TaxID=46245 RepID=A0A6I8W3Q3_DROPS|nr:putative glycine-rich cell wall structural protein 1 [Drosophila persimilis]XP_033237975.1 putative glycine-rich cell wall structural protein 1 [Drosophila pseudoobscura]